MLSRPGSHEAEPLRHFSRLRRYKAACTNLASAVVRRVGSQSVEPFKQTSTLRFFEASETCFNSSGLRVEMSQPESPLKQLPRFCPSGVTALRCDRASSLNNTEATKSNVIKGRIILSFAEFRSHCQRY